MHMGTPGYLERYINSVQDIADILCNLSRYFAICSTFDIGENWQRHSLLVMFQNLTFQTAINFPGVMQTEIPLQKVSLL